MKKIAKIKKRDGVVDSSFDKKNYKKRWPSCLAGSSFKEGLATETEIKKRNTVEDALSATKAAVDEGVVVGGGVALIRALQQIGDLKFEGEEQIGLNILKRALEEPAKQIAFNAGKDGAVVVEEIKKHEGNFGYNAKANKYEDLVEAGIIDPTKVTRSALQNAASIAALLLTTEAVVVELPEKKEPIHSHGMGEGMM